MTLPVTATDALETIGRHVRGGQGLSLFLDYDGTLVPLGRRSAPTQPGDALLDVLAELAQAPRFQLIILSGRTLSSLAAQLPLPALILAGLYGLEVHQAGQRRLRGPALEDIRPVIARVKVDWEQLIGAQPGVALEDKGRAVALHADGLEPAIARGLVQTARQAVADWLPAQDFRFIGGGDYLEVAPAAADKALAVDWFMDQSPRPVPWPVYFGDDDNDDAAFAAVRRRGGLTIGVGTRYTFHNADTGLASPTEVRAWLERIVNETR